MRTNTNQKLALPRHMWIPSLSGQERKMLLTLGDLTMHPDVNSYATVAALRAAVPWAADLGDVDNPDTPGNVAMQSLLRDHLVDEAPELNERYQLTVLGCAMVLLWLLDEQMTTPCPAVSVYNGNFTYATPGAARREATCALRVWQCTDGSYVAVSDNMAEHVGLSVTNGAEWLWASVRRVFDVSATTPLSAFEHYPEYPDSGYDHVWLNQHGSVTFESGTRATVEALIGQPLEERHGG